MNKQGIFEGQANKWTWAAIDCHGSAWLAEGEPVFTGRGTVVQDGIYAMKRRPRFDVTELPQNGLPVEKWEREMFMVEGRTPSIETQVLEGFKPVPEGWGTPESEEPDIVMPEDGDGTHGWADPLSDAKTRAATLYERDALTLVQYMAIFGEVPK